METVQRHKPKQGFFIEVGCPGCGGELEINSDFFITSCTHCGTPLRLILPDSPPAYLLSNRLSEQEARFKIDRLLKSKGLPLTGQTLVYKSLYYPYWKIEAKLLRGRNRKEKISVQIDDRTAEEIVDYSKRSQVTLAPFHITVAASKYIAGIPDSIGVRGETLTVIPFTESAIEDGFDLLEVLRSPQEVVKTIELSLSRLNTIELAEFGENITKIFNPITSLIFFPFGIVEDYAGEGYRRYVLDGLTGRILFTYDSQQEVSNDQGGKVVPSAVGQIADNVRDEFADDENSIGDGFDLSEKGIRLQDVDEAQIPSLAPDEFGAVQVTFHRCNTCGKDLPSKQSCLYICSNCHELTCLDKNIISKPDLLSVECPDKNALYFPFWSFGINKGRYFGSLNELDMLLVPAFNISNFEAMFRLTCRISTAASNLDFEAIEVTDERFVSVDILPSEGMVLANIVHARYELQKTSCLPSQMLPLKTDQISLCYIPFRLDNYFYLDAVLNSITFEKNLAPRQF